MTTQLQTRPSVKLNDGRSIPQLGFGVWKVPDEEAAATVRTAIETGYRMIDTAAIYGNERGVGEAVASTSVPRAELFITTKLWNGDQGYDSTLEAFGASLERLKLDYVDLYLIHWPLPKNGTYLDTWRALIKLREQGLVRSIGVSNFTVPTLQRIMDETGIAPVLNQIELHPRFQQQELRAFHEAHGIATQSWSPLGRGAIADETIKSIAARHGRTPAQIIIRWHLDSGLIVIPKSSTPSRIRENFDVFDFSLDPDDMAAIAKIDEPNGRVGAHPETMT